MEHDSDRDAWYFGVGEGDRYVFLRQHFELTELELKWLGACAAAAGRGVEEELNERASHNEEGSWLRGFEDNPFVLGAAVMDAALGPLAARSPPAPRPFRVNANFVAKGRWWGQWVSKDDPWTSFNTRAPRSAAEWDLAADRWRVGLDAEGRVLLDQALERALALYGEECARFVRMAAKHAADDGTPGETRNEHHVFGGEDSWGGDE